MTLLEKIDEWTKGQEVQLAVTLNEPIGDMDVYSTVFMIVKNDEGYSVHRHFTAFGTWRTSVDVADETIESCMKFINKQFQKEFTRLHNEDHEAIMG